MQLFLDDLERTGKRRAARHGLLEIERAGIEPHREQAGEPAHRAREVDIPEDILATVTLEIEQHRMACTLTRTCTLTRICAPAMPPAPVRHRHHQAGQQHIVDAAMEGRRQAGQQRAGEGGRQRERELAGRAADVAGRIEAAVDQRQRRRAQHAAPERKLVVEARRILGVGRQPLRPAPERGAPWRQRRLPAARNRLPGRGQVRQQDAPGHAVDRKMMDGE